jgi:hypothetical protein
VRRIETEVNVELVRIGWNESEPSSNMRWQIFEVFSSDAVIGLADRFGNFGFVRW